MASDAELAKRAAGGDQTAAGEIYDRYAPLVRAVLLDAVSSQEANDLVQEVFLRARRAASGVDDRNRAPRGHRLPPSHGSSASALCASG
jgi:DNA-directed RNA polymerase specialized sigma24 family protein